MTFKLKWLSQKQRPAVDDYINAPCCIKLSLFFRHLLWMSFISGLQPLWKWGCLFEKLVSLHWWLIAPFCWVYRRWRWECASNVALWPKAVNGGSGAWRRALRTFWPSDWLCSKDRSNWLLVFQVLSLEKASHQFEWLWGFYRCLKAENALLKTALF